LRIVEQFTDIFHEDHRDVCDLLFSPIDMFRSGDTARARILVSAMATATGPHFRYEEESMYPHLVPIFGPEYVTTSHV
jgi:hypothetical protein